MILYGDKEKEQIENDLEEDDFMYPEKGTQKIWLVNWIYLSGDIVINKCKNTKAFLNEDDAVRFANKIKYARNLLGDRVSGTDPWIVEQD